MRQRRSLPLIAAVAASLVGVPVVAAASTDAASTDEGVPIGALRPTRHHPAPEVVPLSEAAPEPAPTTVPPSTAPAAPVPPPPPATTVPPPPPPPPPPSPAPQIDPVWDRLAECESGGDWAINTGNGYYGGLQFAASTWSSLGGSGLPHEHSRQEQIRLATMLRDQSGGYGAWPSCAAQLGLPR